MRIALALLAVAALVGAALFFTGSGRDSGVQPEALGGPLAGPDGGVEPAAPASLTQADGPGPSRATAEATEVGAAEVPSAAAPTAERERGSLRGRVLDSFGRPLAGADVRPSAVGMPTFLAVPKGAKNAWVQTDAAGRFEVALPQGDQTLRIGADGHEWLERRCTVPSSGSLEIGDLQLTQGVILSGRVVDARGVGVADAQVGRSVQRNDGFIVLLAGGDEPMEELTRTDADGLFRVLRYPAGRLELLAEHKRHPRGKLEGEDLRPGERRDGLVIELPAGISVAGVAVGLPADARGMIVRARPLGARGSGLIVESDMFDRAGAGGKEVEVAPDGSFEVLGLPEAKEYRLTLLQRVAGGPEGSGTRRSASVRALPGARDARLVYGDGSRLRLQVVDAGTKAPIERLTASVGLGWSRPVTDPKGKPREHFPGGVVEAGDLWPEGGRSDVTVELTATGYQRWSRSDVRLAAGETLDLGVIELSPLPVVSVRVVDPAGAPVEGARVILREMQPSGAQSDAAANLVTVRGSVSIGVGEAEPSVVRFGDGREEAVTDASGVARLNSLPGKRAKIDVTKMGFAEWRSDTLELPEGQGLQVDVVLFRGTTVAVTVVDRSGAPQPGVSVERGSSEFVQVGDGRYRRVTGADGVALFEHVGLGPQKFRVTPPKDDMGFVMVLDGATLGPEESWTEIDVVDLQPHALTLMLEARAKLVGTIYEDGAPLGGARVELIGDEPGAFLFGNGRSATTDGAGRFEFDSLELGTTVVQVSHPKRAMPTRLTVDLVEGDNQQRFDLAVSVIEGRVQDEEGRPVAGAKVTAERAAGALGGGARVVFATVMVGGDGDEEFSFGNLGGDPEILTDDDGRYQLRGVEADVPLVVKAQKKGYREQRSDEVTVGSGGIRTQFDLVLEAGGTLVVYCAEPGEWMAVANLEGSEAEPKIGRFKSGSTTLRDMNPGTWSVQLQPIGPDEGARSFEPRSVEVRAKETAELRFE